MNEKNTKFQSTILLVICHSVLLVLNGCKTEYIVFDTYVYGFIIFNILNMSVINDYYIIMQCNHIFTYKTCTHMILSTVLFHEKMMVLLFYCLKFVRNNPYIKGILDILKMIPVYFQSS